MISRDISYRTSQALNAPTFHEGFFVVSSHVSLQESGQMEYSHNLDFPEIARVPFPETKTLPKLGGEIRSCFLKLVITNFQIEEKSSRKKLVKRSFPF